MLDIERHKDEIFAPLHRLPNCHKGKHDCPVQAEAPAVNEHVDLRRDEPFPMTSKKGVHPPLHLCVVATNPTRRNCTQVACGFAVMLHMPAILRLPTSSGAR